VRAASDTIVSPTYVPDLVSASLDLLIDGEHGIWHLANGGSISWAELARVAVSRAGLDPDRVVSCAWDDLGSAFPHTPCTALGSSRGALMPSLESALERYFAAAAPLGERRSA
jgi:dTDP-4-dehydrorhamnose reductase